MVASTNTRFAVAVHVLTYLATVGAQGPISSDELSESINVSPVYIRRVMAPLRESGFVNSRSGPNGGWGLMRPAESISLAQVWRLVQKDDPVLGLHGPNPLCPVGIGVGKALATIEREVAEAVEVRLSVLTVADVVSDATLAGVDATRDGWPRRR